MKQPTPTPLPYAHPSIPVNKDIYKLVADKLLTYPGVAEVRSIKPMFGQNHTPSDVMGMVSWLVSSLHQVNQALPEEVTIHNLFDIEWVDTEGNLNGGPDGAESTYTLATANKMRYNEIDVVCDIYLLRCTYSSDTCPTYFEHWWSA